MIRAICVRVPFSILGAVGIAACSSSDPADRERVIDSWGKHLYPTTNLNAVYPPQGGVFPGDVVALCVDPSTTSADKKNKNEATKPSPEDKYKTRADATDRPASAESASAAEAKRFESVRMGRFATVIDAVYDDLINQPQFSSTTNQSSLRMAITYKGRTVNLPIVAFPSSSLIAQTKVDIGLTGTVDAVKGGIGGNRSTNAYFMLSIPKAGMLSLPIPLLEEAIQKSFVADPINRKRIERSFLALKKVSWDCKKIGLFAVSRVYYAKEMVYSYGETVAQAFSAQAQLYIPQGSRAAATNEQIKTSVPKPQKPAASPSTGDSKTDGTTESVQPEVTAVSIARADTADSAVASSDLGIQGGRITASSAHAQGVAFRYNFDEPVAIAVAYVALTVSDAGNITEIEPTPSTGETKDTMHKVPSMD
ncbi:hypothetical protein ACXIUT_03255 [Achromobacter denitrificans]